MPAGRTSRKYSKAKPREGGSLPPVDLAIPAFDQHVFEPRAGMRRGVGRRPFANEPGAAVDLHVIFVERTGRGTFGRTRPIVRRRTSPCSRGAASSRASTARSQGQADAATPANRQCAEVENAQRRRAHLRPRERTDGSVHTRRTRLRVRQRRVPRFTRVRRVPNKLTVRRRS